MKPVHPRPKAPQQLRQTLLTCAANIIAEEGLGSLTLDKVVKGHQQRRFAASLSQQRSAD